MHFVLDSNVWNHLAAYAETDVQDRFASLGGELILPTVGVLELLQIGDDSKRLELCRRAHALLGDRPVILEGPKQMNAAAEWFLAGHTSPHPLLPAPDKYKVALLRRDVLDVFADAWGDGMALTKMASLILLKRSTRIYASQSRQDRKRLLDRRAWLDAHLEVAARGHFQRTNSGLSFEQVAAVVRGAPFIRAYEEFQGLVLHMFGPQLQGGRRSADFADRLYAQFSSHVDVMVTDDRGLRLLLHEHQSASSVANYEVWDSKKLLNWLGLS